MLIYLGFVAMSFNYEKSYDKVVLKWFTGAIVVWTSV